MRNARTFLVVASVFGLNGVAFGAFGAHALKQRLSPEMLSAFETGVRYQLIHALALFVASWGASFKNDTVFRVAAWLFIVGVMLFSGSLYTVALTGLTTFGIVTPFGGLAFLGGWLLLARGFWVGFSH